MKQWLIVGIALFILLGSGAAVYTMTRGLRNNNPGNIRRSPEQWAGLSPSQTDPEFFQFSDAIYGIRAMAKLLQNYQRLYGLRTVRQIISRWAPPSENDTDAYVYDAADEMNVDPDEPLQSAMLPALIAAIIKHENGVQPYSAQEITRGIALAA